MIVKSGLGRNPLLYRLFWSDLQGGAKATYIIFPLAG
jgi:hypothetical protein